MNPTSHLLAALLIGSSSSSLIAQTFTADDLPPYDLNSYRHTNDFAVGNVTFLNSTGSGPDPYAVDPVSLKETTLSLNGGELVVYDLCAEIFIGPTGASSYSVSEGFGSIGASEQTQLRALFSNAYSLFIFARDNLTFDEAATHGAAIQMAYWEIVEDSDSVLTLDEGSANAGLLAVDASETDSGTTSDAVALANTWLANVESGTWTDQGGMFYYYADATTEQDRLWLSTQVIPEPSTALLGLLGFSLAFRRRR